MRSPKVAIIAGPNGSGKTTFYYAKLRNKFPAFVNADELSGSTTTAGPEQDDRNLQAARQAEDLRNEMVRQRRDFAFETVFSRTAYWLNFLAALREARYQIWLFFICTEHPSLNVSRIAVRVEQGGHDVPPAKVHSRFGGSVRTALQARQIVDQLWLLDNTELDRTHRLIAKFVHGELEFVAPVTPEWAKPFLF